MAKYRITGPDGATYQVTAPDGASEAEVMAYAKNSFGPKPAAAAPAPAAPAPNPTDGMTTFDRFAAGAGKSVVDTGRGLGQLLRSVTGDKLGDTLGLPTQADIDEAHRLDKALMDTTAGTVGNITGQVVQLAVPGAVAARTAAVTNAGTKLAAAAPKVAAVVTNPYVKAATQAGAFAATQPVLTGDTRAGNAAEGAAFGAGGQAVASGLSAVARGASNKITPELRDLVSKAEAAGIPVNVAQLSDSKFLKTLQSQLERLPFTGAQGARDRQQEALNRAVSRTFGADVPRITDDVYAGAKTRIGQQFESLTTRNNLNANDPTLLSTLANVADEARRFGTDDTARAVDNAIDELLGKADQAGMVPGKAYQALDSQLGKLTKAGGEKAHFLGRLREATRDAMDSSISAADQAAWKEARGQYRNLKTVRDLVAKDAVEGNISPALLRGRVTASNAGKEALASGRAGELGDLSNVAYRFVRDPIPDSGTAQRLGVMGLLGGAGGAGLMVDPVTTLSVLGAAGTAGRGANSLMNSKALRDYLMNGVQTPIARKLLESGAAGAPLLIPATSNALQQ